MNGECAICQQSLVPDRRTVPDLRSLDCWTDPDGGDVAVTRCGHPFHWLCLRNYLAGVTKQKCPRCPVIICASNTITKLHLEKRNGSPDHREMIKLQEENRSLNYKIHQKDARINKLLKIIDQTKLDVTNAKSRAWAVGKELANEKLRHQDVLKDKETILLQSVLESSKVSDLSVEIAKVKDELRDAKGQLKAVIGQLESKKMAAFKMVNEIAHTPQELSKLKVEVQAKNDQLATREESIQKLSMEIHHLKDVNETSQSSIKMMQQEIGNLTSSLKETSEKLSAKEKSAVALTNEVCRLEQLERRLVGEAEVCKSSQQALLQEVSELKVTLQSANYQLATKEDSIQKLSVETLHLKEINGSNQSSINMMQQEIGDLTSSLKETSEKLSAKEKSAMALTNEVCRLEQLERKLVGEAEACKSSQQVLLQEVSELKLTRKVANYQLTTREESIRKLSVKANHLNNINESNQSSIMAMQQEISELTALKVVEEQLSAKEQTLSNEVCRLEQLERRLVEEAETHRSYQLTMLQNNSHLDVALKSANTLIATQKSERQIMLKEIVNLKLQLETSKCQQQSVQKTTESSHQKLLKELDSWKMSASSAQKQIKSVAFQLDCTKNRLEVQIESSNCQNQAAIKKLSESNASYRALKEQSDAREVTNQTLLKDISDRERVMETLKEEHKAEMAAREASRQSTFEALCISEAALELARERNQLEMKAHQEELLKVRCLEAEKEQRRMEMEAYKKSVEGTRNEVDDLKFELESVRRQHKSEMEAHQKELLKVRCLEAEKEQRRMEMEAYKKSVEGKQKEVDDLKLELESVKRQHKSELGSQEKDILKVRTENLRYWVALEKAEEQSRLEKEAYQKSSEEKQKQIDDHQEELQSLKMRHESELAARDKCYNTIRKSLHGHQRALELAKRQQAETMAMEASMQSLTKEITMLREWKSRVDGYVASQGLFLHELTRLQSTDQSMYKPHKVPLTSDDHCSAIEPSVVTLEKPSHVPVLDVLKVVTVVSGVVSTNKSKPAPVPKSDSLDVVILDEPPLVPYNLSSLNLVTTCPGRSLDAKSRATSGDVTNKNESLASLGKSSFALAAEITKHCSEERAGSGAGNKRGRWDQRSPKIRRKL